MEPRIDKSYVYADRGEHELQGVAEPQRLYAVRWRAEGLPSEGSP